MQQAWEGRTNKYMYRHRRAGRQKGKERLWSRQAKAWMVMGWHGMGRHRLGRHGIGSRSTAGVCLWEESNKGKKQRPKRKRSYARSCGRSIQRQKEGGMAYTIMVVVGVGNKVVWQVQSGMGKGVKSHVSCK